MLACPSKPGPVWHVNRRVTLFIVVCCGCQTVDQRTGVDSDPDGLEIQAGGGGGGGGRGGGFVERKRIEIGDVVNTKCTKYV